MASEGTFQKQIDGLRFLVFLAHDNRSLTKKLCYLASHQYAISLFISRDRDRPPGVLGMAPEGENDGMKKDMSPIPLTSNRQRAFFKSLLEPCVGSWSRPWPAALTDNPETVFIEDLEIGR